MGPARVIVVEDNPALRHFVGAALQGLDIDLVLCPDTAQALQALGAGAGAQLVLTDLMLHRESGLALVERLKHDRALPPVVRVAVFSADVDAPTRGRLEALGVWRILHKPVSVADLQACVRDALSDAGPVAVHAGADAGAPLAADARAEAQAIALYFDGDAVLHAAFKASCLAQFEADVGAGDAACRGNDAAALRHLAHSLATVLETLGCGAIAASAHELQRQAVAGDLDAARASWRSLRRGLLQLVGPPTG